MKRINRWFRAVFGFNQKEINGFIILSILMVLLLAAPFLYTSISSTEPYDSTEDERILQELIVQASKKKETQKIEKKKSKWIPDKYKKESTQNEKYHIIKSGEEQVDRVKPEWVKKKYVKKEIIPFEINAADTTTFKQIRGIGRKLSQRIITYRKKLGGFHSIHQLTEVYGVDSILILENRKYFITPNLDSIHTLDLNTATVKELVHHPYISYKQAIAIANYRDQHGEYALTQDILNIQIIKEKDIEKLKFYLPFK